MTIEGDILHTFGIFTSPSLSQSYVFVICIWLWWIHSSHNLDERGASEPGKQTRSAILDLFFIPWYWSAFLLLGKLFETCTFFLPCKKKKILEHQPTCF